MNAHEEIATIFIEAISPALIDAGFALHGDEYVRVLADGPPQILHLQFSEHSDESHVEWTYNLTCFVPELYAVRGEAPPEEPRFGFGPRVRLAQLLPPAPTEFWYSLGDLPFPPEFLADQAAAEGYDMRDPASVQARVRRDLDEVVIPFFARTRTLADWFALVKSPQGEQCSAFEHVVLALLVGDRAYAEEMLTKAFADRPDVQGYLAERFGVLSRS